MIIPPFLVWSGVFAIGHKAIDAEHRLLVDAINEIHAAEHAGQTLDQLIAQLNDLLAATERHFDRENSVMQKLQHGPKLSEAKRIAFLKALGDVAMDEHLSAHEHELSKLKSIIGAIGSGDDLSRSNPCSELGDWFVQHVIKYDAHLKAVFQAI